MKKFLLAILIIIVVLLVAVYVVLFTSFGNNLLKPKIQEQITKYSPIPLTLDTFVLRLGSFQFNLRDESNITIASNGTFSLLSRSIDGVLNINIKNPSNIKELADSGVNLSENFLIENVIRGTINHLNINTVSNIASGKVRIDTSVDDFTPTKILANIENLRIPELLAIIGKKPYANGIINITADITGDSNLQFSGQAVADISNGSVDSKLIAQDFKITAPETTFVANLIANFNGANLTHKLEFMSNIGNITSSGSTIIESLRTNSTYEVSISDLSPLTPFVGTPIRGRFHTNGTIVGNAKWLHIEGKSNVASSDTTYAISLENYTTPKDAVISIKNLKIEDALSMLVMPSYASGTLNAEADLKNITDAIEGNYAHTIKGKAFRRTLNSEFGLNPKSDIAFNNQTEITFSDGSGVMKSALNTDIASLSVKNALLNINSVAASVPYTLEVSDLRKLAFITSKELKGALSVSGEVKWTQESLYATAGTSIFNGDIDMVLNNNIANVTLKNLNSMGVLEMFQYPRFFSSNINGNIKYDIHTQKGRGELVLNKGSFAANKLTNLIQTLLGFNATKEVYDNVKLDGTINKKQVVANLNMTSNNTSLTGQAMNFDFEADNMDAALLLKVKTYALNTTLRGKIGNPNISIDTKSLGKNILDNVMQNEKVQEQVQKVEEKVEEAVEKLEDKAKDALQKGLEKLLKRD